MKITGKHEPEMPVFIEFEIASAPQPEGIEGLEQIEPKKLQLQIIVNCLKLKKLARTIKKDTKLLLRTLDKMKRHGWLVVDQTDCSKDGLRAERVHIDEPPLCGYCGKPVLNRGDGFMHKLGGGEEMLGKLEDGEMRTIFKKADEARQKEIEAFKAFANWKIEVIKKYRDGNSVQICSMPHLEIEKGAALEEALKKSTRARIEAEGKEDRLTRRFL